MKYEELRPISRAEYLALVGGSDLDKASEAVLRIALNDEDPKWAEAECLRALSDARVPVRLAAATALGHLARRQKGLSPATVSRLFALKSDPDIGGSVEDALDDLVVFARPPAS